MVDNKKPQVGSIIIPPKDPNQEPEVDFEPGEASKGPPKGPDFIVLDPSRTAIITNSRNIRPPGLPPGKWTAIPLPNGKFQWLSQTETGRIYGNKLPLGASTIEIIGEQEARTLDKTALRPELDYQVAPETEVARPLAREVKMRTVEPQGWIEEKPEYSLEYKTRIDQLQKAALGLPAGPQRKFVEQLKKETEQEGKEKLETKNGPVPERDLPIIARMYGELKKFYYQGYADAMSQAKGDEASLYAARAQKAQVNAMRMGMSSLVNLHQGLSIASWEFFFRTLGPLGVALFGPVGILGVPLSAFLENIHDKEIKFGMAYHMGRAWWSPYHLDYLIKTLPEEKAVDLILDIGKKSIYLVSKITGLNAFGRVQAFDDYGRPKHDKYGHPKTTIVFTPLLKLQRGLSATSTFLDILTREKRFLSKIEADRKWLLAPLFDHFSKDKTKREQARDLLLARLARTVGLKSIAKNLRRTDRDPLSFIAILIGGWIFDVTIGNLTRIIMEKLAATKFGVAVQNFFSSKYFETGKMFGSGLADAGKAVFSLNTVGGGLIGYQIAGPWGATIGASSGWMWQTVRNFGTDVARMEWTQNYLKNLQQERLFQRAAGQGELWAKKVTAQEFVQGPRDLKFELKIGKLGPFGFNFTNYPLRWMFTPGPLSRLAYFLNYGGEINLFGKVLKIPAEVAQIFRAIPSTLINGTLIRFYISPFLTELGQQLGWDPAVIGLVNSLPFQYGLPFLWEYKGTLFELGGKLFDRMFFEGKPFLSSWEEFNVARVGGGPGAGFVFDSAGNIEYVAYESGRPGYFELAKPTGLYKNVLQFRYNVWQTYDKIIGKPLSTSFKAFLQQHKTFANLLSRTGDYFSRLGRVGVTNLAGFFIGWELAALIPGAPFWLPFVGGVAGFYLLNPILEFIAGRFGLINLVPAFTSGFWLGAIAQTLLGFAGVTFPAFGIIPSALWFPTLIGGIFAFGPGILTWIGSWGLGGWAASAAGTFFTGLGTALGASAAGLSGLLIAGTIATVAVLTIFTIFVVGSAFWIPFQEELQGLTNKSPCFSIDNPVLSDNKPTFKKGETKDICWTSTINSVELYQDALVQTKTFNPGKDFKTNTYSVEINTPDKQNIAWRGNSPKDVFRQDQVNGQYHLTINQSEAGRITNLNELGFDFNIKPPPDTNNAIFQKQVLAQLQSFATNSQSAQQLIADVAISRGANMAEVYFLVDKEIAFLKSIKPNEGAEDLQTRANTELNTIKEDIKVKNNLSSVIIQRAENINGATGTIYRGCENWSKNKTGIAPVSFCDDILSKVNSAGSQILSSADTFFGTIGTIQQQEIEGKIKGLENLKTQTNSGAVSDGAKQLVEMITKVKTAVPTPPSNPNDHAVQKALQDKLEDIAKDFVPNTQLYYLPQGTTIKICLNVTYNGDDNASASITEKDSATLPIFGPLATNFCQAQVITPINNNGPTNKLGCPTADCKTKGAYDAVHRGRDFSTKMLDPIRSMTDGTIIKQGVEERGFGNYVIVQDNNGFYYLYAHLESFNSVYKEGSKIATGDWVGKSGQSGNADGPHAHVGISSSPGISSFYDNSATTFDPCLYIAGGCK